MTETEMGIRRWLARSFASAFLIVTEAAPAPALAQGSVEGSIELAGERVPITHVYAREGLPRPGEPPHVIILMTDRPAPPDVAASRRAYHAAAAEGRIRGALLVLEPDPRFVLFAPGGAYVDTRVPDIFAGLTLSDLQREKDTVSGHLAMSETGELLYGEAGAPVPYRVDLRFTAPIATAPRATEILTGEAARASPQAAMALRGLEIVRTAGSIAELQAAFHPDHRFSTLPAGENAAALLEAAREMLPAPATFLRSVEQVLIYGDEALVVARDANGTSRVSLRRDGDAWKFADGPIPDD